MKNTDPMHDEILTVEEVATILQLEPATVYARALKNEIPGSFAESTRPALYFQ